MIAARVTLARKRSLIWSSKRCSRGAGLPGRTTIWRTAAGTPAASAGRGTRRARRAPATGTGEQAPGPAGFGSGQPFDVLRPGPALAGAADRVHTGALRRVSDEELTGMIRAWRRLSSWATARELGAIAEFARRRPDEDPGPARTVMWPGGRGHAGPPAARRARRGRPAQRRLPRPGGANPAAQGAPAGGTAGANPAARGAPAAPAGGAGGRPRQRRLPRLPRLAGQPGQPRQRRLPAAAPAGGANPAAAAELPPGGGPPRNRVSRR